jgi:tetratricopeptide (TPR) repeat protein
LWFSDWNWSGAEREYKRALEVNPNSDIAHGAYGRCLSLLARHEEAIAEARRVVEISPALPRSYSWLMEAYILAHRYDQAFEQRQKMLQLDPRADPLENSAWAYRGKGMYQEAIATFLSIRGPYASSPPLLAHLGHTYALAGNRSEAEKIIQKLVAKSVNEGVGAYEVAVVYAGLGDTGRALGWLEKAYKAHEKGCAYLKVDYPMDPLRSDPRFQDLLRRMNFPP